MHQPAILQGVPPAASFLFLDVRADANPKDALRSLGQVFGVNQHIFGLGTRLLRVLGDPPAGFAPMPTLDDGAVAIPATPTDVFIRIHGDDAGQVLHRERALLAQLPEFFGVDRVDGFVHADSRDLSGYVDGTENPTGDDAVAAAFAADGSSVLAVQRWEHNFDQFDALGRQTQDHVIGRERDTNEEIDDAPKWAHVKRTAQEDFQPEAFLLRRSMPWRDHRGAGLVFVAFGSTLAPFEAQLRRMVGLDDGIVDGLFQFTRPVTGGTWWCPGVKDGQLGI